eukprot:14874404-Heterocapsa_arctica.AAC.1
MAMWLSKGGPAHGCSPSVVQMAERICPFEATKCPTAVELHGVTATCPGWLVGFFCGCSCSFHLRWGPMSP